MSALTVKSLAKELGKREKDIKSQWDQAIEIAEEEFGKKQKQFKDQEYSYVKGIIKNMLGMKESVEMDEALKKFKKPYDVNRGLSIIGYGMTPNGNHVVRVELLGGKKKSIQTNTSGLDFTHKTLVGKVKDISDSDLEKAGKEIADYIKKNENAKTEKDSIDEAVDVTKLIKDLSGNFSGSNEEQMKAVQLLKGLATSDDPKSNKFMKALDTATTKISKDMSEKKESVSKRKSKFKEFMEFNTDVASYIDEMYPTEDDDFYPEQGLGEEPIMKGTIPNDEIYPNQMAGMSQGQTEYDETMTSGGFTSPNGPISGTVIPPKEDKTY